MTNGLIKDRKTMFIKGYAVQYFKTLTNRTKIIIYANLPVSKYVSMCEFTIDLVADDYSVESAAKEKIAEIERED